jgi:chaperone modulatory protein CbpM
MPTNPFISAKLFCSSHNIELSFIRSLHESGLIEMTLLENDSYVPVTELEQLEKITRFYFELGINMEGIEAINHLLRQISSMQQEIIELKNRLRLYESH